MRVSYYSQLSQVPEHLLSCLVTAYVKGYGGPPWNEHWTRARTRRKLARELSPPTAFLAIMEGDGADPVAGTCWGASIQCTAISERVVRAHPISRGGVAVTKILTKVDETTVTYVDEIVLVERYRHHGPEPILRLVLPVGECALRQQNGIFCWSGAGSNIVKILQKHWGFRNLGSVEDISFFYLPPPEAQQRSAEVKQFVVALDRAA